MKFLTTIEAAAIIAERTGKPMSDRQIRHEIQIGKIKAEKIAGTYLIKPKAINHYKRRHPGPKSK